MKNYYNKGKRLLVTFEGIDATGKTELIITSIMI